MDKQICISCGSEMRLLGKSKGIPLYRCPQCGLGMTVVPNQLEQYHEYHRDNDYLVAQKQFRNIFQKRLEIVRKFKKGTKVLEIGSSIGTFLSLLQDEGWEVLGVEPSLSAAKVAREREIPTLNTTFEQVNLPKNSFDLIIFNHVLEHMDDPQKALVKAYSLLRKKGVILIDVPNFASFSARLAKTGWQYILPKEHRWHFTPVSLFNLLEHAKFIPLTWEAHSGIWGYGSPLSEVWDSLKNMKKRFFVNVATAMPTYVLTKLKAGTGLTVVAQKL